MRFGATLICGWTLAKGDCKAMGCALHERVEPQGDSAAMRRHSLPLKRSFAQDCRRWCGAYPSPSDMDGAGLYAPCAVTDVVASRP
jgi:hypothetical protein